MVKLQENGAFFVMTNMIVTPGQTQGRCEEVNITIRVSCVWYVCVCVRVI